MHTCYHCGKFIRPTAQATFTNPSNFHRTLGIFPKAYHVKCYQKAEAEAEKELFRPAGH